jgi:CubicO group peptidase (beta-lactamase class C family)
MLQPLEKSKLLSSMPGVSRPIRLEQTLTLSQKVHSPQDWSKVTRYDPAVEIDPPQVEMTRSGVESIWGGVTALYGTGIHPAISFCLRRHGKVVLKRSIGHSKGNGTNDRPGSIKVIASPDDPFCLFSGSKAALALLIHLLVERKQIRLQESMRKWRSGATGTASSPKPSPQASSCNYLLMNKNSNIYIAVLLKSTLR